MNTTTIEITKTQASELDSIANGSYKEKLQTLIDGYNDTAMTEAKVRELIRDEVIREALE